MYHVNVEAGGDTSPEHSPSNTSPPYLDFLFDVQTKRLSAPSSTCVLARYFNDLQKNIHLAILQNCLDQLYLLLRVFPVDEAGLRPNAQFDYVPLVDRMEGEYHRFDEAIETFTNKGKFQRDLYTLCLLIRRGQTEISSCCNFAHFVEKVDSLERTREDEEAFALQYSLNTAYRQELKDLIVKERKQFREELTAMNRRVINMEAEFGHQKNIARFKSQYIARWEKSRQSQNEHKISSTCENYEETIKSVHNETKLESIAHVKIEKFMQEQCQEYLQSVDQWSSDYEREIEQRDMEIYNLKGQRELLGERFVALQKEYEERKVAIAEWLAYKEVKRKEEEERLRLENAAIRIQAWWRGVMVRRCLGRFRKKKKKGKGKGKKGRKDKAAKVGKAKPKVKK